MAKKGKGIESLPQDVAQQLYAKVLEEELGYTDRVNYSEIDHLTLASCLNLRDFIHQDGRISSIPVMLEKIQEYNEFLAQQGQREKEIRDLVERYHLRRQRLVSQLEEVAENFLPQELPLSSRDELCSLYARIVSSSSDKGLTRILAEIAKNCVEGAGIASGIGGVLNTLINKSDEKDRFESSYDLVQKSFYPACQSLIVAMGLKEPAKLNILDEKEGKVALDRIPKLLEAAGWLFFKYPTKYVSKFWDGLEIGIPERLVIEEKLAKLGEEKRKWTVYCDRPGSDYGAC